MAEFALVAVPCFTLLFGIMNFSMALYDYDFVGYSAQAAARYAIVNGATSATPVSASDVQTYVKGLVAGVMDTSLLTVNTTWSPNNNPGSTVTVTVGYTFKPLTGIVSKTNINLTQTASMVISQ